MVRVGSSLSDACNVISGVPKAVFWGRCCLSCLLMTCEITCSVKDDITFKLFADDVKVYACIKNFESAIMLQHRLDLICNWATR